MCYNIDMNKLNSGLALSAALFLGACSHENAQPPASPESLRIEWIDPTNGNPPSSNIIDDKRKKIDENLEAANSVAQLSNNPIAKELVEFAKTNGEPSVITRLGPIAINGPQEKNLKKFFIISLGEGDKGQNPISDSYLEAPANGVYVGDLQTLFMYEKAGFSDKWRGILELHELNHARNNLTGIKNDPNEEAKTRRFHHDLAAQVFGSSYTDTLNATIATIRPDFEAFITNRGPLITPDINVTRIIEGSSPAEARFASSTVFINAVFNLLDEKYGTQDLSKHQQIYQAIFAQLSPGS